MIGKKIGAYEIVAKLGEGGMGEVYRGRDVRLNRTVAIKALPEAFANDAERVARFEREAQVLASLNHPHIAGIYGLEEVDNARYLILEYIEGQSLAERIARSAGPEGPALRTNGAPGLQARGLPFDEAVGIAHQILDALEAAHEKGIIHRDLKPANVMLTADGQAKVLDFGLARVVESDPTSSTSNSPTLTFAATQIGVILGTAAYMAPEQARGRVVDRRCDVWAFGCVFFEMLTGKRLFAGEDVSETLAFVLTRDPEWSALPANVPARLHSLLKRCLERDRKARIPDVSAVRYLLQDALAEPAASSGTPATTVARPRWSRALLIAAAVIVTAFIAGAAVWRFKPSPIEPVARFQFALPDGQAFSGIGRRTIAISPDGGTMVFVAGAKLYSRALNSIDARVIQGTESFQNVTDPVFSPDGASVAFYAALDRAIKRVPVAGGPAVMICQAENPFGMSWSNEGLLIGQGGQGILRVREGASTAETIVKVKNGEFAHGPQLLPGGQNILFTLATGTSADRWDKAQVVVQSLETGSQKVLATGSDGRYSPTGHLLYALGGLVYAQPFDAKRATTTGAAVPVIQGVRRAPAAGANTAATYYAFSATGTLMYVAGPASLGFSQTLALADRQGGITPLKLPSAAYTVARVSPDGKRLAVGTEDKEADIWVYDLTGSTAIRRLTFGGENRFPAWTGDSSRVTFQSNREGDSAIFWQPADGTGAAERLTKPGPGESHTPESWSPKGDRLLFRVTKTGDVSLWVLTLSDRKIAPFGGVHSAIHLPNAVYSPDGRWVAYTGEEQGKVSVFVQPDPPTGAKYQLFVNGADQPHDPTWSATGKELFYNPRSGGFEAVGVTTQPAFAFGNPVAIPRQFTLGPTTAARFYDVMPDGRFVVLVAGDVTVGPAAAAPAAAQIQVVLNWFEELRARVK